MNVPVAARPKVLPLLPTSLMNGFGYIISVYLPSSAPRMTSSLLWTLSHCGQ